MVGVSFGVFLDIFGMHLAALSSQAVSWFVWYVRSSAAVIPKSIVDISNVSTCYYENNALL